MGRPIRAPTPCSKGRSPGRPRPPRTNSSERGPDRFDRGLGLGAVGAAALRHIGAATTTLPAECDGRALDELGGREFLRQVVGHADGDGALAVLALEDERDDAGAKLFLFNIDETAEVLGGDAFDGTADEGS